MPQAHGSLLNRSPRARKSLAPAGAGLRRGRAPAKRKRSHSITAGENPKLDDSRRRSLMRPSKGILKPSNQADDTQDLSQAPPYLDDESTMTTMTTVLGDFRTNVHENGAARKSIGARRVSFAAHAHVRVFESAEQHTGGTSSTTSSPSAAASSSSDDEPAPFPVVPSSPRRAARRSSMHVPSVDQEEDDGEASMDVSYDAIPPPAPGGPILHPTADTANPLSSDDGDEEGDDDEGDMSMTGAFGAGIVQRRRSSAMTRRMRTSIAAPEGGDATEFVVAVERPPPPESAAFRALKAVANAGANGPTEADVDGDGSADMDVTTALARLMHVRESMGAVGEREDSEDEDGDGDFDTEPTVDVTGLMGHLGSEEDREGEDDELTMSAASVVDAPISTSRRRDGSAPPPPAPVPVPASAIPVPVPLLRSPSKAINAAPAVARSPAKLQPPKQFTAAFAPPFQPAKRPPGSAPQQRSGSPVKQSSAPATEPARAGSPVKKPASTGSAVLTTPVQGASTGKKRPAPAAGTAAQPQTASPQKKRAVMLTGDMSATPRPVAVTAPYSVLASTPASAQRQGSPKKSAAVTSNRARRPSGFFRKSIAPADAPPPPAVQQQAQTRLPQLIPRAPEQREYEHSPTVAQIVDEREVSTSSQQERQDPLSTQATTDSLDQPTPAALEERSFPHEAADANENETAPAPVDDDDMEPISVDRFFAMTGIRFMDDLTCPRRSTVHPSQLQRRESNEGEEQKYSLSEYATAMAVDLAQLETMTWIANDIRSAIDKFKAQYRQTEEDAAKDIPLLFREYANAAEDEREQLLYVLKLIKAHTIGSAKASWYDWKRGWVQGLQTNAQRTLDNLDADLRQLDAFASRGGEMLPSLRMEYEQITQELEQERAAVAEIENCDQTFLNELKGTIAEQKHELDVYRNDVKEGEAKLARLEESLQDYEDQARDAKVVIATAQRQMDMQKSSTRAEVFRLHGELHSLQELHLWRATAVSANRVEFVYDARHTVVIPCRRFTPIAEALEVKPCRGDLAHAKDDFPLVTELMYRAARRHAVHDDGEKLTVRKIIQRLTDFWTSYAQLRWQLSFIIIKYPLSFQLTPAGASLDEARGFKATATLLLLKKTSKAYISFEFDTQMMSSWPMEISSLRCDISVAYGNANPRVLGEAVKMRLSEANEDENHACLVDACMEVASQYS